jgi:hypothetical protein
MNREPITLHNLLMRARLQDQKYVWRNYRKDVFLLGNSLCFIFHAIPNGGRMWFRAAIFIWRAVCAHLPISHHYDLKKSIIEMLNNFSFVLVKAYWNSQVIQRCYQLNAYRNSWRSDKTFTWKSSFLNSPVKIKVILYGQQSTLQ